MERMISKKTVLYLLLFAFAFLPEALVEAQNFNGVRWNRDRNNSPRQDRDGSGRTPSTNNATNNQRRYTFEITTTSTSSLQRQEWQYERRSGYQHMQLLFRIRGSQPNFNRVSIAQCHDDQTGSEGVFSIYQVRREGGRYVFGVQGDTTEADNGYSRFDTREINLNTWYRLRLRTRINGRNNSFEIADLYRGSNRIWTNTIRGGGDNEAYYKLGAYRLTNGSGRVEVQFDNIRFWRGSK